MRGSMNERRRSTPRTKVDVELATESRARSTPLLSMSGSGALLQSPQQCLSLAAPAQTAAESPLVEIVGGLSVRLSEPETVAEAKQVACLEALRQAISTTAAVRERTASMVDSKSFHNLIHTLATQYVSGQQILQQSDRGRTVYCKVKAVFHPDDVERVLLAQATVGSRAELVDQNRALKILIRAKTRTAPSSSCTKRSNASIGSEQPTQAPCGNRRR